MTGGDVSRQTAWRKAMEAGEVAILPLVTVCSGKKAVSAGRNELADRVKEVFAYGDGARWAEASDGCFPGQVRVLDAYHYEKKMKTLTAGEVCGRFAGRLRRAVSRGGRDGFGGIVSEAAEALGAAMGPGKEREKRLRGVSEAASHLLSRWDAVMNMGREGSIGSCTEPMVSHVFSERFSRNPMGWPKHGLAKMSQIRVFMENGGKVRPSDMGLGKKPEGEPRTAPAFVRKHEGLVKRQEEEVFAGAKDWRIFEHGHIEWSAPSGTRAVLQALVRMRETA